MRLLVLIILVSCGKSDFVKNSTEDHDKDYSIDSAFIEYVDSFKQDFNRDFKIKISFDDRESSIAGTCYTYTDGYREIKIDRDYWNSINSNAKEQLIYHELGHCILDLGHNDDYSVKAGYYCPDSIMNSHAFNSFHIDNCYIPFFSDYLNEMLN